VPRLPVEQADRIFRLLFERVAEDAAELLETANKINDASIDIKQVLRTLYEGSEQSSTEQYFESIKNNYDIATYKLGTCAGEIGDLIKLFVNARYSERISAAQRNTTRDTIAADTARQLTSSMNILKGKMTRRYANSASFLINFTNLVRRIEGAQAILLNRQPRWKELVRPALGEVVGMVVPSFGMLVALAEAQSPDIDRLLKEIEQAKKQMEKLNRFDAVLQHQIILADHTSSLISTAAEFEREYFDEFNTTFAPYL
jgi:hypothetical protein